MGFLNSFIFAFYIGGHYIVRYAWPAATVCQPGQPTFWCLPVHFRWKFVVLKRCGFILLRAEK